MSIIVVIFMLLGWALLFIMNEIWRRAYTRMNQDWFEQLKALSKRLEP